MKRMDLHIHSWFSDGSLSPSALVKEAADREISVIALADHDGTFGIDEAVKAGKEQGVQVIGGVEISCYLDTLDCTMHMLGLGIDHREERMQRKILWMREKRRERNEEMLAIFGRMGISLQREELQWYPGQEYLGKPNIARALVRRGLADSVSQAFRSEKLLAAPQLKIVRKDRVAAAEAIELIHGAGGIAVLAHPYKVFWKGRVAPSHPGYVIRQQAILERLIAEGMDGMECFYSHQSREQTEYLCRLARSYGLMITAGSDYHGAEIRESVTMAGCWQGWEEETLPWAVEAVEAAAERALRGRTV